MPACWKAFHFGVSVLSVFESLVGWSRNTVIKSASDLLMVGNPKIIPVGILAKVLVFQASHKNGAYRQILSPRARLLAQTFEVFLAGVVV